VSHAVEGPAVALPLPVVCFFYQGQEQPGIVISTEAAQAFVSSVAEKSAPLPQFSNRFIPWSLRCPRFIFRIFSPKSHVKPETT
jgi:hypothetical protein